MLLDTLLSQLAPHECLNCSSEGALLCTACMSFLAPLPSACYRCRRISERSKTCETCRQHSDLYAVRAATIYEGLAKELVWQLKFQGAQAAANEIAKLLVPLLPDSSDIVIVPVPTATSRVRQRGYDQATLIARALASHAKVAYSPALRRQGQHHQVGSSRTQRISQLQTAYRVARERDIATKHIVIIDDVLTTGATLEAAAKVLKTAGAKRVSGLVFARA